MQTTLELAMEPAHLTDDGSWPRTDAFRAVLAEIRTVWHPNQIEVARDRDYRFLLIEQWSRRRTESANFAGEVVAAWIANSDGIVRITSSEDATHRRYI